MFKMPPVFKHAKYLQWMYYHCHMFEVSNPLIEQDFFFMLERIDTYCFLVTNLYVESSV